MLERLPNWLFRAVRCNAEGCRHVKTAQFQTDPLPKNRTSSHTRLAIVTQPFGFIFPFNSCNYGEFPVNTVRFYPHAVYLRVVRVSRTYRVLTTKPFSARASERDNVKE
jgi:hypothetical protein